MLTNGTFKDGELMAVNGGVYHLETMKYLTSNDCLIDKRMRYFEAEAIKTNENT